MLARLCRVAERRVGQRERIVRAGRLRILLQHLFEVGDGRSWIVPRQCRPTEAVARRHRPRVERQRLRELRFGGLGLARMRDTYSPSHTSVDTSSGRSCIARSNSARDLSIVALVAIQLCRGSTASGTRRGRAICALRKRASAGIRILRRHEQLSHLAVGLAHLRRLDADADSPCQAERRIAIANLLLRRRRHLRQVGQRHGTQSRPSGALRAAAPRPARTAADEPA